MIVLALLVVMSTGNARAEEIAKASAPTREAMKVLEDAAASIRDPKIRAVVLDVLKDPAPTFVVDKNKARNALVDAKLVEASVTVGALFPATKALSFAAAPGGVLGKHHGHPGGLAVHTAVNLGSGKAIAAVYRARYGVTLDEDIVVAAAILHDAMKAWTLQFQDDGSLIVQPLVAGTSSHHPFIVAELIHRGMPNALIIAVASAHEPPEAEGAKVARFLVAGALLAGKDARKLNLVVDGGADTWRLAQPTRIEASVSHLSDHDYVLSDPAYAVVDAALQRVIGGDRWKKHEALARVPGMTLYAAFVDAGDDGVKRALAR